MGIAENANCKIFYYIGSNVSYLSKEYEFIKRLIQVSQVPITIETHLAYAPEAYIHGQACIVSFNESILLDQVSVKALKLPIKMAMKIHVVNNSTWAIKSKCPIRKDVMI